MGKENIKSGLARSFWGLMALLFIVTALGGGVYAFLQNTQQNKNDQPNTSYLTCAPGALPPQTETKTKLEGTQLAGFSPIKKIDQLKCIDLKVGSGTTAQSSSSITANYTGAVASTGKIFQSSLDNNGTPFSTALGGVIPGWQQGIPGMKAGGTRRLLIPAALAYGATGACKTQPTNGVCKDYSIPPNADLVFDITLLAVQ